jgi:putative transposase
MMQIVRTEQIWIKHDVVIGDLCHFSKNLWNEANYIIRQEFLGNGRWTRYNTLAGTLKTSENFKAINAQTAQQILKVLDRSWNSFFKSNKEWSSHPEKFLGRPKLPSYKPKEGEFMLVFTNQQVSIRDGYLQFPKNLNLQPIKTRLTDWTDLCEVRIIPNGCNYVCEIIHKTTNEEGEINKRWYSKLKNQNRIVGIDLGLRNIVTIGNNIGEQPIVIKGGVLKSINQFYNKRKAELQSIYDLQGIKHGSRMDKLNSKRNSKIKDSMHKISRYTIDYCLKHNIGTIVIGHNDNWKQETDLGKRNNQNFVQIPYFKLIQMLQYKAEGAGIKILKQEESHTSKCSFFDNEQIMHHDIYQGKRFCRGLFRSSNGKIINADVQGALNIIKKAIPNAFAKGIEGVGLHPIRVNPLGGNIL